MSAGAGLFHFFGAIMTAVLMAHFFRAGEYGLCAAAAGLIVFLFSRSAWKKYVVSFMLFGAAGEWCLTAGTLVQMRMLFGQDYLRAAAILLAVIFLTVCCAAFLYEYAGKKQEYLAKLKAAVFMICFGLILFVGSLAPVKMLMLERYLPLFGAVQAFLLAWYGVWIFEKLERRSTHAKYRKRIWLIFCAVFFGQLVLGLLGFEKFLMSGKLHFPVPAFIYFTALYKGAAGFMLGLVLFAVLLTGSAWCSHLCYFGPFDAAAAQKKVPLPGRLEKCLAYSRYAVFGTGGITAVLLAYFQCSLTVVLLFSWAYIAVTFAVILLLSKKYGIMAHCSAFCPMGIIINVLGKCSLWRMRVSSACDNCGACEKVCRYRAVSAESRAAGTVRFNCSLCLDCMDVCRHNAISLRLAGFKTEPQKARLAFLCFVVVIHVLFLSFARV